MVQRYDYFAESENFESFDRGEWVKYEDYAALEKLLEWVCLNFNLYDLPPCEQRNKLEELELL